MIGCSYHVSTTDQNLECQLSSTTDYASDDLERTVPRITDHGAEVHFVRDGLTFGTDDDVPISRFQMQMLGAFAEWELE